MDPNARVRADFNLKLFNLKRALIVGFKWIGEKQAYPVAEVLNLLRSVRKLELIVPSKVPGTILLKFQPVSRIKVTANGASVPIARPRSTKLATIENDL